MSSSPRLPSVLLLVLAVLVGSAAIAGVPEGWSQGVKAAGTAAVLGPVEPVQIVVPEAVGARVQGDTALFYFSPTCPHCQHAMPEANELARSLEGDLAFLGVASSRTSPEELEAFAKEYEAAFPMMIDETGGFARAVGARSTPSLYLTRPVEGARPAGGLVEMEVFEGYSPYQRGLAGIVRMRRNLDDPFAHFEGYQGEITCHACHTEEATSWAISHHATAYRTLYLRDRAEDLECVGCHVTGMGEPGGFEVGDHGSPLVNVSCEACHGPSGPHDGVPTEATSTCEGCHDDKHSIAFSVAKGLPHIDHYEASGLDTAELQRRLQAVADGTAARPLLAFPEGPTVGAEACASCHKSQHRWARKDDPHGRAMDRLEGEQASDLACVACHATPTEMTGPPPAELAGYRLEEGVACESCHGPGGAHVAAPSADNIVGLGESCPECVIEAVCTSCHTPQWDPTWELRARLDAIDH